MCYFHRGAVLKIPVGNLLHTAVGTPFGHVKCSRYVHSAVDTAVDVDGAHAHPYHQLMYVRMAPWPHYNWQRQASATGGAVAVPLVTFAHRLTRMYVNTDTNLALKTPKPDAAHVSHTLCLPMPPGPTIG